MSITTLPSASPSRTNSLKSSSESTAISKPERIGKLTSMATGMIAGLVTGSTARVSLKAGFAPSMIAAGLASLAKSISVTCSSPAAGSSNDQLAVTKVRITSPAAKLPANS